MSEGLGDERMITRIEAWMEGLTIVEVLEFVDGEDQRWRQITLSDGSVVQILLTHPWLIVAPQ